MSVSVIIVTYNRVRLLKKCLKSLLFQTKYVNNIFIVNNNSNDGTYNYLNNVKNDIIHPINMKKNLGGAGGFSIGTKIAYEYGNDDYFWLMDDDTIVKKDALSQLIISAKKLHNKFGFLCSNVRWYKTKEPSYLNVPVVSKDWNKRANLGLIKLISASFVSLLITRQMVSKVGLPIADMFIWADDVEYTTRLSRIYDSYFVSNSIVLHESATDKPNVSFMKSVNNNDTENVFNTPMNRLLYYKCKYRNKLFISRKYYRFSKTIEYILYYLLVLLKVPFKSRNHRMKRFMYVLCGIIHGLVFNPEIKYPNK